MGPRPFGRGRGGQGAAPVSRKVKLQWGRDLSVAEGAWRPRANNHLRRGFNGAATFRSRKAKTWSACSAGPRASMGPRPFGRGRNVLIGRRARPPHGFNGAATFRSRKVPKAIHNVRSHQASMGPRPFGRGRNRVYRGARAGRTASMGPRPFGRGRCMETIQPMLSMHLLQWGRDLSVAEGLWRAAPVLRQRARFNGAATFRSRKGVYPPSYRPPIR